MPRAWCRHAAPQGAAGRPLRGSAAALIVATNHNAQNVNYHEPGKSARQFVLMNGEITIDSLHRLFEFVLVKIANRD